MIGNNPFEKEVEKSLPRDVVLVCAKSICYLIWFLVFQSQFATCLGNMLVSNRELPQPQRLDEPWNEVSEF